MITRGLGSDKLVTIGLGQTIFGPIYREIIKFSLAIKQLFITDKIL